MRRAGVVLALAAVLLGVAYPAQAAWRQRLKLVSWTNEVRSPDVQLGWRLSRAARDHTRAMIRADRLFHTRSCDWCEVVGIAPAGRLRDLFVAFRLSPRHNATLTYSRFRRVGVAVIYNDGFFWVTMIFR